MPPGALMVGLVSTHSRLKAAGWPAMRFAARSVRFNTQPPEGGWNCLILTMYRVVCFNTQPPEGGWAKAGNKHVLIIVSTHSRLKAAASWRLR